MDKFIYLFQAKDNGYGNTDYTYFSSDTKITQEMSDKFIREIAVAPGRLGSNFDDFREACEKNGIIVEKLKGQHRLTELENVLTNIQGNY